ncbi:MAG: hypothetical protein H7062_21435 [Candidatus Saccharimonas sp.]|nr:hypothetical protein [Planctomycetaceae bacterium]
MRDDPIVAEVRRTREELAARFNFDVDAIFADMQSRQTTLGQRLVLPKKRRGLVDESDRQRKPVLAE